MKKSRLILMVGAVSGVFGGLAHGQNDPGPSIPPAMRGKAPSPTPAAAGQALQRQALDKLRRRFEEADLDANGKITEQEAQRAGLGFIAANFAEIDAAGKGSVSFDDVSRYLTRRALAEQRGR